MHTGLCLIVPFTVLGSAMQTTPSQGTVDATPVAPGVASLHFGDVDGDGLKDVFVVGDAGQPVLLHNLGEGRFEDITLASGLAGLDLVTFGLFADFDGDGRDDLFVGRASANERVYRNLGNASFEPLASGIELGEVDWAARAFDIDGDQRLDLWLTTEDGERLYRNLGAARFERVELPLASPSTPGSVFGADATSAGDDANAPIGEREFRLARERSMRTRLASASQAQRAQPGASSFDESSASSGPLALGNRCPQQVKDAVTGNCVSVSTTPTFGTLYPLGPQFFITPQGVGIGGNIGVGQSAGLAKLSLNATGPGLFSAYTSDLAAQFDLTTSATQWRLNSAQASSGMHQLSVRNVAWSKTALVLDNLGHAAIGVDSTDFSSALVVGGDLQVDILNQSSLNSWGALRFGGTGSGESIGSDRTSGTSNPAGLDFLTNSVSRMSISNAGNVGVGTTTPGNKLELVDSASTVAKFRGSNTAGTTLDLQNTSSGGRSWGLSTSGSTSGSAGAFSVQDHSAAATRLFINTSGNVGIGTTTPGEKLDVVGGVNVDDGNTNDGGLGTGLSFGTGESEGICSKRTPQYNTNGLDFYTAGTPRLQIKNSGSIGIGTWAPEALLHIVRGDCNVPLANQNSTLVIENNGTNYLSMLAPSGSARGILFGQTSNTEMGGIYYCPPTVLDGLDFRVNGGITRLVISSAGDVGIGTNLYTPDSRLHVLAGSAGTVSAAAGSVLTCENSGNAYASILSPDANERGLFFGEPSSNVAGGILYNTAAVQDGLELRTNGNNTRVAIGSSGNVGIGTTTPEARLHILNGSAGSVTAFTNSVLAIENSTNNFVSLLSPDASERGVLFGEPSNNLAGSIIYNSPSVQDGLEFRTNGNQSRMSITGGGSLGIGTTTPDGRLHVMANSAGAVTANGFSVIVAENNADAFVSLLTPDANERGILFGETTNNVAGGIIYNNVANPDGLQLRTNGNTTRMVIDGSGKVGIGRTPTTNTLEVEGDASKTTASGWAANSDRRIKTAVHEIDGALETLDRVRPCAFRYTDEYKAAHPSIEDKDYYNVIAQEFAEVFPDYVHDSGENGILQVDTYPAVIHAIAAVKELHGIVKQQQDEIATLNERMARMEAALATLTAADRGR